MDAIISTSVRGFVRLAARNKDIFQEDIVTRVSTGHDRSRLLLLVLLGSLTVAVVGAALGLFLMLRLEYMKMQEKKSTIIKQIPFLIIIVHMQMMIRRRGKKAGGVEENIEPEKEEPVKEYKVSKLSTLLMMIRMTMRIKSEQVDDCDHHNMKTEVMISIQKT